ncbi:MAG: ATP-binding protein [Lachnospiraceae bacterium]|nr:ATP-binding protein [Lachnospiraceae bacterium]
MIEDYLVIFLNLLSLLPAGLFCYFPMRKRLRRSVSRTALISGLHFFGFIATASLFALYFNLPPHIIRLPVLALFFPVYYKSLDIHISKAIGYYIYVFTIVLIIYNFANACDAVKNPELGAGIYTMYDSILQLIFVSAFAAAVFYPVKRFGTVLVEMTLSPAIWVAAALIPGIIIFFNMMMRVEKYSTLFVNKVFQAYIVLHGVSFFIILVLTVFFYFIVTRVYRETQTQEEIKVLKLQERYFKAQQQYMNDTARARHDFKHTIHTLERLVSDGDIEEIRKYLSRYSDSMPRNELTYYCENTAVNALLNYYMEQFKKAKTHFTLEADMPEKLPVTDVEMCAVIGNILENAMLACLEIKPEKRYVDLAIRVENDAQLYIVAENSFNGVVQIENGKYRTTHSGNGIGLSSVMAVAQNCGGTARFSHEGGEFFSDVILPLKSNI